MYDNSPWSARARANDRLARARHDLYWASAHAPEDLPRARKEADKAMTAYALAQRACERSARRHALAA